MSIPVQNIVKMVQQVPNEFMQRFTQMLSQLVSNFASVAQKSLDQSREHYQLNSTGLTVTGSKRRTPSVPFSVGRGDKLTTDFDSEDDKAENKMRFGK